MCKVKPSRHVSELLIGLWFYMAWMPQFLIEFILDDGICICACVLSFLELKLGVTGYHRCLQPIVRRYTLKAGTAWAREIL